MDKVVDLKSAIHAKKQRKAIRLLDLEASYVALEICLANLNINDLRELNLLKIDIRKCMKILGKKIKDEK